MDMIRVPLKPTEFRPPKPSDLVTEVANFQRAHWGELLPFIQALSGEKPSIHGAADLDEASCIFKIQEIAAENGFAVLTSVPANKLRAANRYAYKRNTGFAIRQLKAQAKRLLLEQKKP